MIASASPPHAEARHLSRSPSPEPHLHIDRSVDAAGLTVSLDGARILIDAGRRVRGVLRITALDALGQELGRCAVKLTMEADDWRHCATSVAAGTLTCLRIVFDSAPGR